MIFLPATLYAAALMAVACARYYEHANKNATLEVIGTYTFKGADGAVIQQVNYYKNSNKSADSGGAKGEGAGGAGIQQVNSHKNASKSAESARALGKEAGGAGIQQVNSHKNASKSAESARATAKPAGGDVIQHVNSHKSSNKSAESGGAKRVGETKPPSWNASKLAEREGHDERSHIGRRVLPEETRQESEAAVLEERVVALVKGLIGQGLLGDGVRSSNSSEAEIVYIDLRGVEDNSLEQGKGIDHGIKQKAGDVDVQRRPAEKREGPLPGVLVGFGGEGPGQYGLLDEDTYRNLKGLTPSTKGSAWRKSEVKTTPGLGTYGVHDRNGNLLIAYDGAAGNVRGSSKGEDLSYHLAVTAKTSQAGQYEVREVAQEKRSIAIDEPARKLPKQTFFVPAGSDSFDVAVGSVIRVQ